MESSDRNSSWNPLIRRMGGETSNFWSTEPVWLSRWVRSFCIGGNGAPRSPQSSHPFWQGTTASRPRRHPVKDSNDALVHGTNVDHSCYVCKLYGNTDVTGMLMKERVEWKESTNHIHKECFARKGDGKTRAGKPGRVLLVVWEGLSQSQVGERLLKATQHSV